MVKISNSNAVTISDALLHIARNLDGIVPIKVGSFGEFVKGVWGQGYDHPEYFQSWHIMLICEDVEKSLQEHKNYVCIMPRLHLKSTVLGYAFSVWNFLRTVHLGDSNGLYLSYSDGMAVTHIQEMNKHVRRNAQLMEWMRDKAPDADFAFRYSAHSNDVEMKHGGLFSFKRGMHVNRHMIVDDVLRDPENPLNMQQLDKIENFFFDESMYIPTKEAIVIVMGTPMLPGDLLTKLKSDERFNYLFLPALDPLPGHRVLMPSLFDEKWLLREQQSKPSTFQKEFLLSPALLSESYFSYEDIKNCEDESLPSLDPYRNHTLNADYIVAGFDVGKKRHPSHLAVFAYYNSNKRVVQIHQSFMDGWPYTKQVQFLNNVAEYFSIDKGYIDNTRAELEERGLKNVWRPTVFTARQKREMAQIFDTFVHSGNLKLIANERQRAQIICVDNELKAPDTPLGHGDAFFSISLGLRALYEHISLGSKDVGDVRDLIAEKPLYAVPAVKFGVLAESEVCPNCGESKGWIREHKKCLFCHALAVSKQYGDTQHPMFG